MSPVSGRPDGPDYWRSLDERADTPEFRALVEREFPTFLDEALPPSSRRTFLKLVSASAALAGLTACRWPVEEIVPFAYRPEGYVPGASRQFATAWDLDGATLGLLVTSYDGRPIKIEGNPDHPASMGATSARAQATILELYDPDRSRTVLRDRGRASAWDDLAAFMRERFPALRDARGRGVRVLARPSSSPALAALRTRLLETLPEARWVEWSPVSRDAERAGTALAFGRPLRPVLRLSQASVVASFDDDFLFEHPDAVRNAREFAAARRVKDGRIVRLWVAESAYSVTGANAERRVPLAPSEIPAAAACLAASLAAKGLALPADLAAAVAPFRSHALAPHVEAIAADLAGSRGAGLVLAGPSQPPHVHALVHALNVALGSAGRTVAYVEDPDGARAPGEQELRGLTEEMASGAVDTLLVLGGNPVHDAPADLEFGRHLRSVATSIHLSLRADETSLAATWHVPEQHFLESWGDSRSWDGTYAIVQPLIEPLYGGKSAVEMVAALLGETDARGYDLVRGAFAASGSGDLEARWRRVLHDGLAPGSAWTPVDPSVAPATWAGALATAPAGRGTGRLELLFRPSPALHDGRFANNAWLQELPDPLTKLTWDNAAVMGPATAEELGVTTGDLVRVRTATGAAELPVYVMPGHAPGCVTVHLGYGRTACGTVGAGVGVNVYPLRASAGLHATEASVEPTGGKYPLAVTQDHHAIDRLGARERAARVPVLVREIPVAALLAGATAGGEGHRADQPATELTRPVPGGQGGASDIGPAAALPPKPPQLHRSFDYAGHKWGMAIDLNACIGCGACMMACQAENNVPSVGKDEVARGREMHWIRVDRYFRGDPERPSVVFQPMTCHHCENAPCEPVCPVAATVHDSEGLNVMVYNRCVGTRYCSNNCPYKVRRFNWFNNHKHEDPIETMVYNPEVSVRGRGVMEKCTFCTQRIEAVKIRAKNERRPIRDGEIVPACAQACPAEAIVFGDLNDESSAVHGMQLDARAYGVLEELNTRPRLRYLARLTGEAPTAGGDEGSHG